jgi:hypothetical protein
MVKKADIRGKSWVAHEKLRRLARIFSQLPRKSASEPLGESLKLSSACTHLKEVELH